MILAILFLAVVVIILGIIVYNTKHLEEGGIVLMMLGSFGALVTLIVFVALLSSYTSISYNEARIEILEENNAQIETRIEAAVNKYLEHEQEIIDLEKIDAMFLVMQIPELKADKLIKQEIDLYLENNSEIRKLKLDRVERSMIAWWLWFGS